ncbi:Protein of unknown function [Micromonospora echinofusca]|uniref:DUF3307 domain-containing protein n=1 Tax=Micromonospora echinofusca TaxID=47858 RepID=A0A1C5G4F2_MICEH|nr:DUF3307 domain-containing protein [Micromonospora echinofusca]SCG14588.1 Protein of unknown function [Micromonospora echinofusca]
MFNVSDGVPAGGEPVAVTFAAVFVALFVAHQVGDHWIQTQHQASHKGDAGWSGRWACVKHVLTYCATAMVSLAGLAAVTGWCPDGVPAVVGMAVSGVSHFVIDRRWPLRWLADRLGKCPDWLERGGGLYALDQSAHIGFLFIAALVMAS